MVGGRIDNRRPRRGCNLALTFLGAGDAGDELKLQEQRGPQSRISRRD